jgi:hypothetical protein
VLENKYSLLIYKEALEGSFMRKWGQLRTVNYDPAWDFTVRTETGINEFYLIVYLELKHKTNPAIFTEFTLKVPVNIGLCDSLPESFIREHDSTEFFTATVAQCNGDNDTDSDGHSDNDEIAAGTNPYVFSDSPLPQDNSCSSCHL